MAAGATSAKGRQSTRGLTAVASVTLAALAGILGAACGPSYQALYEGDARFEHCYALEETAATMQSRSDCWRDWTLRYTYGQTRDRVEYAAARYRALSRAPEAPTDEAMMEAAPGEGRGSSVAAPAPTSAFAPPPKTFQESDAGAGAMSNLPGYTDAGPRAETAAAEETAAPSPSKPPGTDCSSGCDGAWSRCKGSCGARCDGCTRDYKKCMRGCFAK